jgi:ACR3 family arsenite transporter
MNSANCRQGAGSIGGIGGLMWKLLSYLQKNLIWTSPAMMMAGLLFGCLWEAAFLKRAIVPLTFLMVYTMMVNLQIEKVFSTEGQRCQLATQVINFAIIPLLRYSSDSGSSPASRW